MVREYQAQLIGSFNDWFERQDAGESLWPAFDRWVRDALNQYLGARRVRCFRTSDEGRRLVSLTTQLEEPLWPPSGLPGLISHVVQIGRAYVQNQHDNSETINQLVDDWAETVRRTDGLKAAVPQMLLPIRLTGQTVGLVLAGEVAEPIRLEEAGPAALSGLLAVFWRLVAQTQALATAECTDRASGVLTRADLTAAGERVLADSVRDGEPVVVMALAVEGVRRLNDGGYWTLRDALMRQIGNQMRAKLRSDDIVGRFSEDRFVAVLRRLDLALGRMIAGKLLAAVEALLAEQPVLQELVTVRCGLSDSGGDNLEAAVRRAFEALRLARLEDQNAPVILPSPRQEEQRVAGGAP